MATTAEIPMQNCITLAMGNSDTLYFHNAIGIAGRSMESKALLKSRKQTVAICFDTRPHMSCILTHYCFLYLYHVFCVFIFNFMSLINSAFMKFVNLNFLSKNFFLHSKLLPIGIPEYDFWRHHSYFEQIPQHILH